MKIKIDKTWMVFRLRHGSPPQKKARERGRQRGTSSRTWKTIKISTYRDRKKNEKRRKSGASFASI